jgi:hypothetical protein
MRVLLIAALLALQAGFVAAMKDRRFIAEIEKANLNLAPSSGDEVARAAAAVRNN